MTDADVSTLQQQLADGQKPKVALLRASALGPAGTPGVVVTISEPAVGECVIVRISGDELPFSADELTCRGTLTPWGQGGSSGGGKWQAGIINPTGTIGIEEILKTHAPSSNNPASVLHLRSVWS